MMELSDNLCVSCQKMQETDQKYKDFISKLSHEVRNPLTLIYSSLQLLEKDCPEISSNSLWPQIKLDVTSTIQLLRDVSSLNRPKSQNFSVISAEEFLSSISASFCGIMKDRQIAFSFTYSPSAQNAAIYGDEIRLREAVTNLLINAADAVSDTKTNFSNTKPTSTIQLSAEIDGTDLCIHVTDNGCGIPEEYLDTLFDPFVTHKSNGTGLGLHIVKSVAKQHGGSISVASSTEAGISYTDFCLRLPLHTS